MDRLAGLVDRLLGSQQDRSLTFEFDGLGIFGRTYRSVGDEAQLVVARQAGRKAELGLDRAALVDLPGEQWPRPFIGYQQLDPDRPRLGDIVVVGVGDDDPDCGSASGEVLRLAEDVNDGPAQNLRDGLDALDRGSPVVGILEAIAEALPDEVFEGMGFSGLITCCQEPSPLLASTLRSTRPRT